MEEVLFSGQYDDLQMLSQNPRFTVFKAVRVSDGLPVILKSTTSVFPTTAEETYLQNEYKLLVDIASDFVPHAIDYFQKDNRPFLVMENFGGISLENYLKRSKFSLKEFLEFAIKLASLLVYIHEKNVIHKDIHPDNIILQPDTGDVMIIDYGLATRLEREHSFHQPVNMLVGTIAYMSPEQTGRMNRYVDNRSDLYSLGLCFYKMLTGRAPYESSDPVELVYCQVAKDLDLAPLRKAGTPLPLIAIVQKLSQKLADNRYQNARGLLFDLQYCYAFVREDKPVEPFEIGTRDIVLKLRLPDKIYGREKEIEQLFNVFEKVGRGENHLMMVEGFSGIGKTALVYEIHKPNAGKNGFFVTGKFDQYKSNIPFAGFVKALSELARSILCEPPQVLTYYKETIERVLGANGAVLGQLVPEVSLLLGKKEEVFQLNPEESKHRFLFALKDFIRVFTSSGRPVTIFLDDLQWADDSSLSLLTELCQVDLPYVFIIGAYRSKEVHVGHPLRQTIDRIKGFKSITEINLEALSHDDVHELVANALNISRDETSKLAGIIYRHTAGNPFYTTEFLKSIYAKGLIVADPVSASWHFDLNAINEFEVTNNVLDIISARVRELPELSKRAVEIASCIGFQFDLKTLSLITEKKPSELSELLWSSISGEIVFPLSEKYTLLSSDDDLGVSYAFQHDRIHQAVYQGMESAMRSELHYKIGKLLLSKYAGDVLDENIIEVVRHLNNAEALITTEDERRELAVLNAKAGKKAEISVAYHAARQYFANGIRLLEGKGWEEDYNLMYQLKFGFALNAYQTGNMEEAEKTIDTLLEKAPNTYDKVRVLSMRLRQYTTIGKPEQAIEQGINGLRLLGIKLNENPGALTVFKEVIKIKRALRNRKPADLLFEPEMNDEGMLLAARLLSEIGPAAYPLGRDNLYALTSLKVVSLSLKYGNCGESSFAYTTYGAVLGEAFGDYKSAEAFGKLAVDLNTKLNNIEYRCRVIAAYGTLIHHFSRHWQDATAWFVKAVEAGYLSGDLFFLAYSAAATGFWDPNLPLDKSLNLQGEYLHLIKDIGYVDALSIKQLYLQYTKNLLGLTNSTDSFDDDDFNEQECYELMVSRNFFTGLGTYYILKSEILYRIGKYNDAWQYVLKAETCRKSLVSNAFLIRLCKIGFLTACRLYSDASLPVKGQLRMAMRSNLGKMEKWAAFNPHNFAHLVALMRAEKASVTGKARTAMKWYDEAVQLSINHAWLNDQAQACEHAAAHCFRNSLRVQGAFFANQAISAYIAWGAVAKAEQLQEIFRPFLSLVKSASSSVAEKKVASLDNISAGSDDLDLSSIIRTSQAISGEIILESLLRKMIGIITMNAGAERGYFILKTDDDLVVQASFADDAVAVMQNIPLKDYSFIPQSIINYVLHLKESVVLTDAAKTGEFTRDPYIMSHNTKSILCSPVILLSNVYGVIYLENNKLSGAFTQDRLVVLNLLSSQMAISIHNAILYSRMEEKVAERTTELSQSIKMLKATQSQLIQSEKMASLGELSAGIAHEIKNPLNFINNFSELNAELAEELIDLIKEGDLEEAIHIANDIRDNENKISSHGKRADSIIKGMLSHSRGSSGKKEPTNINALADEYLRLTFHGHKARDRAFDANFKFNPDASIPDIPVVPQEIGQVLINLFNNAFYAVRDKQKKRNGGYLPMVEVTTRQMAGIVVLSVKDNGSGIPDTIKEKIFQPFFTTKPTGEGTGLGLSLSYDIIKAHGGEMEVESMEGEGTTFIIKLPIE